MHSHEFIQKVKELYAETNSIRKVSRLLNTAPSSVKYMVENNYNRTKKTGGPRKALTNRDNLAIKLEVKRVKQAGQRVTATKIKENLGLECSNKTVERSLKKLNLRYRNSKKKIILKKTHREARVSIATRWLCENHP